MNFSGTCLVCVLASGVNVQECPDGRFECLERNHEIACSDRNASVESCRNWLQILERQSTRVSTKEITLKIGQANQALAVLTKDPIASKEYMSRAIRTYRILIERDGSDAQAMFALAAVTKDRAERVELLRRGIALEPDRFAIQFLAGELARRGGKEATLEAAKLMETAFNQQTGRNKWHLASETYRLYLSAGATEKAAEFQKRASRYLGVDELTEIPPDISPDVVSRTLSSLCDHYAIPVLGSRKCINSIGVVVGHVVSNESRGAREELARSAADAMVEVAEAESDLEKEYPDWDQTFRLWLEKLIGRGFEIFSVYFAYARVTTGNQRLAALEKSVALAPESGHAAYRLGLEYAQRERWKEAINQLMRAKQLLPPGQREAVEFDLKNAKAKASEMRNRSDH